MRTPLVTCHMAVVVLERVGACQCNLICILYSSSSERRYQGPVTINCDNYVGRYMVRLVRADMISKPPQ